MAIVLNEYEWAEKVIHDRSLGSRPTETLNRVAKYYYEKGYSKREIRRLLDQFLISCDPDASLFSWSDALDRITKNASRYELIQIDCIPVTEKELSKIAEISSAYGQRLAFTLLCVSKYWDLVSVHNNHWVNSPDKEIFSMANISISSKRQDLLYGKLLDAGLIKASKKIDNLNVQVLFQDDCDGNPVLLIKDFRNLGYQYMRLGGGPYIECEKCGIVVKAVEHKRYQTKRKDQHYNGRGRAQRYCSACAAEMRIKSTVDSVIRHRRLASK